MKFHKINWDRFSSWWLPSYLKKPRMLTWVRVMLSPVRALYARLLAFRDFAKEQILITNQTLVLQAEVRKLLGETSVVIINQGNRREKVYTWFLTELLGINPVQYLYTYFLRENSQKKHYRYFLREQVSEFDFIVYLPDTYLLSEEKKRTLIAFINKYKLPDKRFMILQVPPDQIPTPIGVGVTLPPELGELLSRQVLSHLNLLDTSTIVFASSGTVEVVQDISSAALSPKFPLTQYNATKQPAWVDKAGLVTSTTATSIGLGFSNHSLLDDGDALSIALLIQMGSSSEAALLIGIDSQGEIIIQDPRRGQVVGKDLEAGIVISLADDAPKEGNIWHSVIIIFKDNFTKIACFVDGQAQSTTPGIMLDLIPLFFEFFVDDDQQQEAAPATDLSIAQMLILDKEPTPEEVIQIDDYFREVKEFYEL